jgi:hypothetical protein
VVGSCEFSCIAVLGAERVQECWVVVSSVYCGVWSRESAGVVGGCEFSLLRCWEQRECRSGGWL